MNAELFGSLPHCKRSREQFTPDPLTLVARIDKEICQHPLRWTQSNGSNANDPLIVTGNDEPLWSLSINSKPMVEISLDLVLRVLLSCYSEYANFVHDIKL